MAVKTIAVLGGTGRTGEWALLGGLQRGYNLRVLGRSPDKVQATLVKLLGEEEAAGLAGRVEVVKGGVGDTDALISLCRGVDAVLSFLGMPANKAPSR